MSAKTVNFLSNGNIDTTTKIGRVYFCFAEDEFDNIKNEHPEFTKTECHNECLFRFYKLVDQYNRYKKYLEFANI